MSDFTQTFSNDSSPTDRTTNRAANALVRGGAVCAFLGVALGAFGAHALQETAHMDAHYLEVWRTGVQYHLVHGLALLITGLLVPRLPKSTLAVWAGRLFGVGIVVFGGSLYALALTSLLPSGPVKILGAITPLGGVCFLIAWALLAASTFSSAPSSGNVRTP